MLEWVPGAVLARLTIESNGAYVYEEVNANGGQLWFESGFVFIDGNSIDINILLDSDGTNNETSTLTYAISGNTLTLTEIDIRQDECFYSDEMMYAVNLEFRSSD